MKKNYTIIKHKIKKNKRNKTKRKKVKSQKRKKTYKNYKNGGSTIYDIDEDKIIKSDELTADGNHFFRKMYSKHKGKNDVRHIEKQLVEFIMRNPHPNIVTFYDVNNEYLDMEELNTKIIDNDKPEIIAIMREVKDFLQNIGIMYIDWKFDNIGKSKDGNYKLFDFDASGIINLDTNEWIVTPPNFWSFRNAIKNNCTTPKKMDDWSFEHNIVGNKSITCD
jgi:hypothetical protein